MSVEVLDRPERAVARELVDTRRRWIRLTELVGEGVEASFVFYLVGVAVKGLDQRPARPGDARLSSPVDLLAISIAAARAGGKIWFEYRNKQIESTNHECTIRGSVGAASADEALERVLPLWTATAQTFGRADSDWVFEPQVPAPDLAPELGSQTIRLRRSPVLIKPSFSSRVGFRPPVEHHKVDPLLLSLTGAWGALENTITAIASTPMPVTIRWALEPVALAPKQVEHLIAALTWLNSAPPKGLTYARHSRASAAADSDVQSELSRTLACWIRRPNGYRVRCELNASTPLPASVMVALHQDTPGLMPIDRCSESPSSETVLDLSELAHEDLGLPGILPPRTLLLALGARPLCGSNHAALTTEGPIVGRLPGAADLVLRVPQSHRDQHTYLIGASGSGKSTFMYNSIVHDLSRGRGVCVIDPHGQLFDQVLEAIPLSRTEDVIVIDPHDREWAVGLNLLSSDGGDPAFQRQIATSEVLRILDRLYDLHATGGPMFEAYLRNAMFLAMDSPSTGGTLLEVVRVFEERDFRRELMNSSTDEAAVSFWKRQAEPASGDASLDTMRPYITSKLNQFTQNPFVRPMIGQTRDTVDFGHAMDARKIILVNLAVGHIGIRDAQLIGMLILSKLLRAAFSRPGSAREGYQVYVDEFHYFVTDTMAAALSQARKYGLCLSIAHQHFSQLLETRLGAQLLDAVLGNVGSKLLFRLGPADAERAAGWVRPELRAEDLQRLGNYDVVASLPSIKGPSAPMIVRTLPRVECPYERASVSTIRSLQHNYARRRTDVEAEIAHRRHAASPDQVRQR